MRCSCRKGQSKCGPGCQCVGCTNALDGRSSDFEELEVEENTKEIVDTTDEEFDESEEDASEMRAVFGSDSEDDI